MTPWIAFLRGVNVGGRGALPMKLLALCLKEAGLWDVRTYVQSGNVVFLAKANSTDVVARRVEAVLAQDFKREIPVFVLSPDELARAMAANPYPAAEA